MREHCIILNFGLLPWDPITSKCGHFSYCRGHVKIESYCPKCNFTRITSHFTAVIESSKQDKLKNYVKSCVFRESHFFYSKRTIRDPWQFILIPALIESCKEWVFLPKNSQSGKTLRLSLKSYMLALEHFAFDRFQLHGSNKLSSSGHPFTSLFPIKRPIRRYHPKNGANSTFRIFQK